MSDGQMSWGQLLLSSNENETKSSPSNQKIQGSSSALSSEPNTENDASVAPAKAKIKSSAKTKVRSQVHSQANHLQGSTVTQAKIKKSKQTKSTLERKAASTGLQAKEVLARNESNFLTNSLDSTRVEPTTVDPLLPHETKTGKNVDKPVDDVKVKIFETSSGAKGARGGAIRSMDLEDHEANSLEQNEDGKVFSVSELNRGISQLLEGQFPLLWLKGEISNFKAHTSGHFYFSLKDAKAQINAVMFRGFNTHLRFKPKDGMEVLVRGKITVYEPRGNYQIFCETMEPVGAGALQRAFEELKSKLHAEGLFDDAKKRRLPVLPQHIAIVTSPTGAAIRDMLNVLARRYRGARVTIVPCKVQGEQAPSEIVRAIELAQGLEDVDVMIVGRGGGSIEDLWAFNDEAVARAIACSRVPVVSGVGHEIDFTIADFVADLRAPTPSAAAELVVRNASDLAERVRGLRRSLNLNITRVLQFKRQEVLGHSRQLIDPQRRIQDSILRCDELLQRLEGAVARQIKMIHQQNQYGDRLRELMNQIITRKSEKFAKAVAVLDSLSPLKVLDRGYSIVMSADGRLVSDAQRLVVGETVNVRMSVGSIEAEIKKINEKG